MKNCIRLLIIGLYLLSFSLTTTAQDFVGVKQTKILVPYNMAISYNKTSNLIFPFAIKSVDRGSADILIQKAKGVENILQVKAAQRDFENTNISVVTSDGRFYSFLISYAANPSSLNIVLNNDTVEAIIHEAPLNEEKIKSMAEQVKNQPVFMNKNTRNQKMQLALKSIYLSEGVIWFNLHLKNTSLIGYSPYCIRFFIHDKNVSKRTAKQETELQPLYKQPMLMVKGDGEINYICAFPTFTIPSSQELIIEVCEQNGGRTLILPVSYRTILKARLLEN